jgi:hypothetical protein
VAGGARRRYAPRPLSSLSSREDPSLTLPLLVGQLVSGGARRSRSGDGGPAASTSAHVDPTDNDDGELWSARDEEAHPDLRHQWAPALVSSDDVCDTSGLD